MDTREHILDVAQRLAQSRGFNAFSYADIAETVGIRKASIHHHFPAKEDLESALVERYRAHFSEKLDVIEHDARTAADLIKNYCALYRETLANGSLCLCGMMASDIAALPVALQKPLQGFFDDQIAWLTRALSQGSRRKEWPLPTGGAAQRAKSVLATLQGGLIIARATNDPAFFDVLSSDLLKQLRR
jgi:TetR/AcrR family transcriptional regulator, transcriptional repressor for nem operon